MRGRLAKRGPLERFLKEGGPSKYGASVAVNTNAMDHFNIER